MNQLLLGASIPFVLFVIAYAAHKFRASLPMLLLAPLITVLSAIWAIVPDIPRMLGMTNLYCHMVHARWTNIFYYHYTIDMRETDASGYVYGLILIAAAFLYAAWRELQMLEQD